MTVEVVTALVGLVLEGIGSVGSTPITLGRLVSKMREISIDLVVVDTTPGMRSILSLRCVEEMSEISLPTVQNAVMNHGILAILGTRSKHPSSLKQCMAWLSLTSTPKAGQILANTSERFA